MSDADIHARVVELETRYMEQQALLEDLSGVLYQQQRTIDVLQAEIKRLQQKLAAEPGLVDANVQEKPPHY